KDHDEYEDPNWKMEEHGESVKTGMTLAELQQSRKDAPIWKSNRAAAPGGIAVKRAARARAVEHGDKIPREVQPMLTTLVGEPFDDPAWLFELKWDGYRAIAVVEKDGVTLTSRNGKDLLGQFPEMKELARSFRSLPIEVDGELCVLDENGKPDFQALQARDKAVPGLKRRKPSPVVYVVFDLIYADGRDLRKQPLEERKRLLESLIVPDRSVMFSKHVFGNGNDLYAAAAQRGLEGIVGKVRTSPYRSGVRSREWVKIKSKRRQEFVIGGYTEPRGSRKGFGAILIGYYDGADLVYAGHVGTGFDQNLLRDLMARFKPLERKTSPFVNTPKTNTPAHWIAPELVCEVTFAEWTREGILRQPVFLGLRFDKNPKTVVREREQHGHSV
ncbi:MAG: non-homologous end-joining DNA ligase, partial [Candidatus Eremiobacteraeota bacterium]|nr:non-homologous end-joining DNA ligase [Candidatus Eremiobacteraeota bacterium]